VHGTVIARPDDYLKYTCIVHRQVNTETA